MFEDTEDTGLQEPVSMPEPQVAAEAAPAKVHADSPPKPSTAEVEQVMSSGMQFLAGIFKMATGKDLGLDGQTIEINQGTGEVVMKFKLPV